MENLMSVASYVFNRYQETMGEKIDEMKLHKLLYLRKESQLSKETSRFFRKIFMDGNLAQFLKK